MRMEDMRPEARERVRRIRAKLCELAVGYKAVKPEACQACESPCEYGMEMLAALGMEQPTRESEQKEQFHQDRRMRKIIKGITRMAEQVLWRSAGKCVLLCYHDLGNLRLEQEHGEE